MTMRVGVNRVDAVLDQYQKDLGELYPGGEIRAIACAVFFDRFGWSAGDLMLNRDLSLSESELLQVMLPLRRLRTGEPLQYVLGATDFHGLRIGVDSSVLIPRPETEELVDLVVRSTVGTPARILDIGTGSGCIALALKKRFLRSEVLASDVSMAALHRARANAEQNNLTVTWIEHDVLSQTPLPITPASLQLIASNPPYIPFSEAGTLGVNVREHEPHLALFVQGQDPLLFYRRIAELGCELLAPDGVLWFEGHYKFAESVGELLRSAGYRYVQVLRDLSGHPRFISSKR